jgi:hypothetical protein
MSTIDVTKFVTAFIITCAARRKFIGIDNYLQRLEAGVDEQWQAEFRTPRPIIRQAHR